MKIIYICFLFFFTACDSVIKLNSSQIKNAKVTKISFINNKLIIQGSRLNPARYVNLNSSLFNENFIIEKKSDSEIIATGSRAFNLDITKFFNLVLSDAYGSTSFPINFKIQSLFNSNSGVDYGLQINPTANSAGTAGYSALKIDVTETSVGNGEKMLTDMQINGVSKFSVDNNGNLNAAGIIRSDLIDVSTISSNGNYNIPNIDHAQIWHGSLPAGDNDIFTVPAGKRAMVKYSVVNPTVGSISYYTTAKLGGNYFRTGNSAAVGSGLFSSSNYYNLWLEAGEVFSLNSSASGLNFFGTAYVLPETSELKTIKIYNVSLGLNTLYTVPSGKRAYGMGFSLFYGASGSSGLVSCSNGSGGPRDYTIYHIPSGQVAGASTISSSNSNVASNGFLSSATSMILNSDDSIAISTDSALGGQLCWTNIIEK